jgi:uncharacterized repeat protein (TIGR01451 family)
MKGGVAGGWTCNYTITVTNTGPGSYNGQLQVQDTIPAGTTATFSGSGWGCVNGGTVYTCSRNVSLPAVGSTVSLAVQVTGPADVGRQLQCDVINKAKITIASGGTDKNTVATDDEDKATAHIPQLCQMVAPPPPPPVQRECPPNTVGVYPDCKSVIVRPTECPHGTTGKYPVCCYPPQVFRNGQCVGKPQPAECPKGTTGKPPVCCERPFLYRNGQCVCPPRTTGKYPVCCTPPQVFRDGQCVGKPQPAECPKGKIGKPPVCCDRATQLYVNNTCVKKPGKQCPQGMTGTPPNCKPAVLRKCPPGTTGRYPLCKKIILVRKCPAGSVGTPPNCRPLLFKKFRGGGQRVQ